MRKFLMLVLSIFSLVLAGCVTSDSMQKGIGPTLGGQAHGGGVAYMGNAEKLVLDKDGGVGGRCQLCQDPEHGLAACKATAEAKGIAVCPEMLDLSLPRGTLMCQVVAGPHQGTFVPFGTAGYSCWMNGPTSCACVG